MNPLTSAAILGAGSLGTALAKLLAPKLDVHPARFHRTGVRGGHQPRPPESRNISPTSTLAPNVRATMDHREALAMPLVIFAVPTVAIRSEAEQARRPRPAA